ncbi:MAG: restriction endonuclease subunit S [Bacillota bacterium]
MIDSNRKNVNDFNEKSLPSGWECKPLSEVCNIVSGGTPDRSCSEYWEGGTFPWATPTDITSDNKRTIKNTKEYITEAGLKNSSAKLVPIGSLLMTSRATIGEIKINEVEMCTNQGFKTLVPNELVDNWFLFYQMKFLKEKYEVLGSGSTFLEVSKKDAENFNIITPLLIVEQKEISRILLTVDNAIEKTELLIEKYTDIKTGLMQDLLTGRVRVKNGVQTEENKFKESIIGLIPEDWNESFLSDYCEIQGGYAFESKDYCEDGIQLIRIGSLFNNELNLDRDPVFLPYEFKNIYPNYVVKPDDILISMTGTIGKRDYGFAVKIPSMNKEFMLNQRVGKFIIKEGIDRDYLFYVLHSDYYLTTLYTRAGGTKQANLTSQQILQIKVAVPEIEEQKAIADILNVKDDIIEKEYAYLNKLKLLKQGLMQDLLTGKVRVKVEVNGDE